MLATLNGETAGRELRLPEYELLVAILDRAAQDLSGGFCMPSERDEVMIDARQWFQSSNIEPFSFLWICEHLSLEPAAVRTAMLGSVQWKSKIMGVKVSLASNTHLVGV